MKMIEAKKVVPLIRLILLDNPNIEKICKGMQDVVNIHTIEAEPVKHGRWEKWNGDDRHHCTVCECYANAERDSYGYIAYEFLDNYCSNCGCRMDGGDDE